MDCKDLVELVTDYLEEKLPEHVQAEFEDHIAGCDGCANYLEQIRQTIRLAGRIRAEDLSVEQRSELVHLFHNWKRS